MDENLQLLNTNFETQMALQPCRLSRRNRSTGTDSQTPNTRVDKICH